MAQTDREQKRTTENSGKDSDKMIKQIYKSQSVGPQNLNDLDAMPPGHRPTVDWRQPEIKETSSLVVTDPSSDLSKTKALKANSKMSINSEKQFNY